MDRDRLWNDILDNNNYLIYMINVIFQLIHNI